jgi:hypothetical protein
MDTGTPSPDAWLTSLRFESVCFDTMIIRHLVHAGGGDFLKAAFAGRMVWPEAVASELRLQAGGRQGRDPVPGLSAFLAVCGAEVLELSEEEDQEVEDIRLEMYTRKELRTDPTRHLGEAQCLQACSREPGYPLACNDGHARLWAHRHKVRVFHAIDVLKLFARLGICRPARAWELYESAVQKTGLFELPGFPVLTARDSFISDASTMAGLWHSEQRTAP